MSTICPDHTRRPFFPLVVVALLAGSVLACSSEASEENAEGVSEMEPSSGAALPTGASMPAESPPDAVTPAVPGMDSPNGPTPPEATPPANVAPPSIPPPSIPPPSIPPPEGPAMPPPAVPAVPAPAAPGSTPPAPPAGGGAAPLPAAGMAGAPGAGGMTALGGAPNTVGGAGEAPLDIPRPQPGQVDTQAAPFTTADGLLDQGNDDTLGLTVAPGTETATLFTATDGSDKYVNGVALAAFKGWIYAMWQSSPKDEDTTDTWTAYSRSQDGVTWSDPMPLTMPGTDQRGSGGWWATADTLVAYINLYPRDVSPRGGVTEFLTSTDGLTWSELQVLPMKDGGDFKGIFEQDPHALPDGRILNAAHFQPGLTVAPCYTDDPTGLSGWVRAPFESSAANERVSQEIEPSWFLRSDGGVVMVFRDQKSSFRKLASVSPDWGETWSKPVRTDMPDSRTKQSAGNLPDGTAFLVGNPVAEKRRWPLAVTLSADGFVFDRGFLLRGGDDLPGQRYSGKAKTLGYNYPKSLVSGGYLYVGYTTNKEDVQVTRVPLTALAP